MAKELTALQEDQKLLLLSAQERSQVMQSELDRVTR